LGGKKKKQGVCGALVFWVGFFGGGGGGYRALYLYRILQFCTAHKYYTTNQGSG